MARELGLGAFRSNKGDRGLEKRITALEGLTQLAGDRLLDLGCADGTFTRRFAQTFNHVTAVDVEPERLEAFRAEIAGTPLEDQITIRQMPGEHLDLPDNSFDAVTMIEVLEHVIDVDETLGEIHRVLVPGGRLMMTSPNKWFPFETHGVFMFGKRRSPQYAPFLPWVPPLHRRMADARNFTVTELTKRAQAKGLRLVGSDYIMPPFDRSGVGGKIRKVTDAMEQSKLSWLGMALVMVFEKDASL
jgi:ubiquinone/menaquinone biosynthesis C-methylase UbiE